MLDHELSRFLLSLVLLLSFALIIGHVFSLLGLPRVVGEICAGLILGPSLLGLFAPNLFDWIFSGFPEQGKLLSAFYWLGLIFLMFTAGFKVSTKLAEGDRRLVFMLIAGGIGLPFLFGLLAANWIPNAMAANSFAFALVIATASAVTSIPVLTRIFLDLEMLSGRFAQVVLSAAAVQDLILWIVLSIALAVQQGPAESSFSFRDISSVIAGTLVFAAVALFLFPLTLRYAGRILLKDSPDASLVGYTLLACLILVSIASVLHVNIVFAALLAGVAIGRLPGSRLDPVKQNIANLAVWFFVPIYFALVGLQMDIPGNFDPRLIFGFLVASSMVKVASVVLFTRLAGVPWGKALDFGVTMNARGGPGIVLASLAYAARIINEGFFVALVVVSIVSSLIAGIWLKIRRAPLET
jgi:Kef-type K+ transport system membrane component KefB